MTPEDLAVATALGWKNRGEYWTRGDSDTLWPPPYCYCSDPGPTSEAEVLAHVKTLGQVEAGAFVGECELLWHRRSSRAAT